MPVFLSPVFIAAFSLPETAQAQSEGEKWEFATVEIMTKSATTLDEDQVAKRFNGERYKYAVLITEDGVEKISGSVPELFKKMSEQGWKLVNADGAGGLQLHYHFQRPAHD